MIEKLFRFGTLGLRQFQSMSVNRPGKADKGKSCTGTAVIIIGAKGKFAQSGR